MFLAVGARSTYVANGTLEKRPRRGDIVLDNVAFSTAIGKVGDTKSGEVMHLCVQPVGSAPGVVGAHLCFASDADAFWRPVLFLAAW